MEFEDFENMLNLRREENGNLFQDSPKGGESPATGNLFQIVPSNIPSLETAKQCLEGSKEDLSDCPDKIEDLVEEPNGQWRATTIVFTCYKKSALDDPEAWLRTLQKQCNWVLGQVEKCPKTGRLHIQGMANCGKNPGRWGFLKGEDTWKAKCIAPCASIKYCSKSKTQVEGPWEFGERPVFGQSAKAQKKQDDKRLQTQAILEGDIQDMVRNGELSWRDYEKAKKFKTIFIADTRASEQRNAPIDHGMPHEWVYGGTGTGKTTYARTQFLDHYLKGLNKWWDDYIGQETVILEDFGKTHAFLGDYLKVWADKWPFKAEIKGGSMNIRPKRVVVTSNYHPREIWEDPQIYEPLERRFNIINKQ